MPADILLAKAQDGSLRPVTADDADVISKWRVGQGVRVEATQVRPRSLQHHRLYFGGLLELAMQYWEPTGGLIAEGERQTLLRFAKWLEDQSGETGAISTATETFLQELAERRAQKMEAPEKSKKALHEWVKREAGYYDLEQTPSGVRKVTRSISFASMGQDEFDEFYRAAFSVVWRFVLSRTFTDEDEAQGAINQLMMMG